MTKVLSVQNSKIFQGNSLILENVNFDVEESEFVYLVGKTGYGKSSLMKTIYGDLPLIEGKIHCCGYDLENLKRKDIPFLRRKLGIVFQDFQLLNDRNIFKNLEFNLLATGWNDKIERENRINEVLKEVNLHTKEFKMPFELSGGEQQRLSIARALLNKPELLIADEPTGNLDPDTSIEIMNLIHRISREGTAVLMATHDYYMIDKFPARILKVEQNTVKDLGSILHS